MNSPRGSGRTPARLDREGSISPQPLDPTSDTSLPSSQTPDSPNSSDTQYANGYSVNSLFASLPFNVISRILWSIDANSFASLSILNRKWYEVAQQVELYAHHLSRCPSYALSNNLISGPFRKNDLFRLKTKFAAEVRRNLFDAYLRPRRTFINLISINANSAAAFPAGEAFRFEFSPNARTILALSSSRIYVLDATQDPPIVIRQLKTLRRPISASVTDDGSLLAVLSSKHQVNIYGLTPQGVQHLQVIVLDNLPKIIAIASEGTVLAASYEAGIEVFSLAANSLTTDRRAVRSEAVDTLRFSGDGSMLVGSSLSMDDPNAVVISAPFYTENDPDLSAREIHCRMWTTQILFPQISSVCSHVTLLPGHIEGDAYWLFAFDHSLMSYRAVRTDDTRAGVAYFLSPPGADRFDTPVPTIAPSASACGTLAVAAFEGPGLWLYGIPERLDLSPDMAAVVERQNERRSHNGIPLTSATGNVEPLMAYSPSNSASDYSIEDDGLAGKVDWRQSLFVKCRNVHGISGQTAARWVEHPDSSNVRCSKRLVVVAPGGVSLVGDELVDEGMPIDGSRMCLLDFNYSTSVAEDRTLTIEVGEGEAEVLSEHTGSLATEVAMERRRTIRAIPVVDGSRMQLGRSVTSISPPVVPLLEEGLRRGSLSSPSSPIEQSRSSQVYAASGLHRAVTASGFRHARYPPRPPLGSQQYMSQDHPQYHRTNSRGRPVSEDSWETPPPPYAGANGMSQQRRTSYGSVSPVNELTHGQLLQMQHRAGEQQHLQNQFRPYHAIVAERSANTSDAVMTSRAMPAGPAPSQYEELMMAARSRGASEESLDAVTEVSSPPPSSPDLGLVSRLSRPNINASYDGRPMTHHGGVSRNWRSPSRSVSMPISPSISELSRSPILEQPVLGPALPQNTSPISLTGANLQNRLNHPVPPVPGAPQPFITSVSTQQPVYGYENQRTYQQNRESNPYVSMPTPDQMANLNRHVSQSGLHRPPAVINTNFVHKPQPSGVPPSPPRGAWGATGIPGSPTFNQARNVPNGFSHARDNSRESHMSHLASASAPNLLLQRPNYGRLDTISSINDTQEVVENSGYPRSRSHSMIQAAVMTHAEPSAYHETSRQTPIGGRYGKKSKKKKDDTAKKGSRCLVM